MIIKRVMKYYMYFYREDSWVTVNTIYCNSKTRAIYAADELLFITRDPLRRLSHLILLFPRLVCELDPTPQTYCVRDIPE